MTLFIILSFGLILNAVALAVIGYMNMLYWKKHALEDRQLLIKTLTFIANQEKDRIDVLTTLLGKLHSQDSSKS